MASVKEDIAEIKAAVSRIEDGLNGNHGKPGIFTEIALLKASAAWAGRLVWIVCTAAITSLASAVFAFTKRGGE